LIYVTDYYGAKKGGLDWKNCGAQAEQFYLPSSFFFLLHGPHYQFGQRPNRRRQFISCRDMPNVMRHYYENAKNGFRRACKGLKVK
jgi:hypothetical protein